MTDGVTLNPGVGGAKIATDELATLNGAPVPEPVHVQRTKVGFGPDGDFRDVDGDHPLPVTGPATDAQLRAAPLPVTGPATNAELRATPLPVSVAEIEIKNDSGNPLPVTGPATDAQLRAAPLPVTGPATNAELRATPLPVSVAEIEIKNDSGNPLPVSSAQLPTALGSQTKANSFSVTLASDQDAATGSYQAAGNNLLALIDSDIGQPSVAAASSDTGTFPLIALVKRALLNWANLLARIPAALGQTAMAGSWPVAIASDQGPLNVRPDNVADGQLITGSVTSATTVVSANMAGYSGGVFHVTSNGVGNTITFEQSNDNSTWETLQTSQVNGTAGFGATTGSVNGRQFQSGMAFVRARVSTYGSGTVTVVLSLKRQSSPVIGLSLNASTASIGNLTRVSPFTDSSTALAANATFTGTGRNTSGANYAFFVANVFADQAGTLFIDLSLDSGTTYRTIKTQAVTAGTAVELEAKVTGAAGTATLYRVRYTNGASAQGAFQLSSAFRA